MTLAHNLAVLQSSLSRLKAERVIGVLQNDIFEAIDDLCHLGELAVGSDTRINYPVRAHGDLTLFQKLRDCISAAPKNDSERYLPLLDCAENLLRQISQIPIPKDGHLGILKALRIYFSFLFDQYGFDITDEQPTGMRLSRGAVIVELRWATQSSLSFSIRRGDLGDFWIEDLLHMHGDNRYQSCPQAIHLATQSDIDSWFLFISDVLHQYGDELLRGNPGAFDRLRRAQSERDAEYVTKMDAQSGRK